MQNSSSQEWRNVGDGLVYARSTFLACTLTRIVLGAFLVWTACFSPLLSPFLSVVLSCRTCDLICCEIETSRMLTQSLREGEDDV